MATKNKPIETLRDGSLKATIWKNTHEKGDFYSVQFSRTYKDSGGNWQDGQSFSGSELLRLARLATKAYDRTSELRRQNAEATEEQSTPDDGRVP